MLKFQENYTTAYLFFEDFILVIFVFIDDLYQAVAQDFLTYSPSLKAGDCAINNQCLKREV